MALLDAFSSKPGKQAAEAANLARTQGLDKGFAKATGFLDAGLGDATTTYERAASPFSEFIDSGLGANRAYGDAIGLGGDEGYARATESFRAQPGYNFQVDEANEAIKRNAAATGMLGSGNTLTAVAERTRNMADAEYQKYLDNLFRGVGSGQTAAQGQANVLSNLANAQLGTGQQKANYGWQQETGIGGSQAQMEADKFAAKQSADANLWGAVFNIGSMAAKFAGGMPA